MSRKPRGVVRDLLAAMSARVIMLPLAAVGSILTTRLVNEALGPQSFAVYSLVAGVPLMASFADLGVGVAVTKSASTAAADPVRFRAVLRQGLLISFSIATLIAAASTLVGVAGLWSNLLGLSDPKLNMPISLAMIVFGFSVPGGLGRSVLLGIGRYERSIVLQGLTPVVSLGVVGAAIGLGAQTHGIVAVSSLGIFLVNWTGFLFAVVSMPVKSVDQRKQQRGVMGEVIRTAMPMTVLVAGGGVLFQSGRLVLSHTSTLQQVAVYAALWTFFQPLLSVVQAVGQALLPRFAAARTAGYASRGEIQAATITSAMIGLFGGLGLTALGPLAVELATGGKVEADMFQCAILGSVLAVQASMLPSGMTLTFPRGLWLLSMTQWVAAAIAVTIGVLGSAQLGATAPMLGLLAATTIGQAIPTIIAASYYLNYQERTHCHRALRN